MLSFRIVASVLKNIFSKVYDKIQSLEKRLKQQWIKLIFSGS